MEAVLCEQQDHAEMPKHYHLSGEYTVRLQRLEAFRGRVEKALGEVAGLPEGFRTEINDALKTIDA